MTPNCQADSSEIEPQISKVWRAIKSYAAAYRTLEKLQPDQPNNPGQSLLKKGDQKTGVIGEFYVYLYLKARHPDSSVQYKGHSEGGIDISIDGHAVEVKTVSAYSDKRGISPIHRRKTGNGCGLDVQLFVVYLNEGFEPARVWFFENLQAVFSGVGSPVRRGQRIPVIHGDSSPKKNTGSKWVWKGENLTEAFRTTLRKCLFPERIEGPGSTPTNRE